MRRAVPFFLALSLSIAALLYSPPASTAASMAETPSVYVTLPWITGMARFIVGSTINVYPLSAWNETGTLKNVRRVPGDAPVIALDPLDAKRYGLEAGRLGLYFLYENLPLPDEKRDSLQFDASALPFLSQRLLMVISRLRPDNYAFYQRRLAEFQSRVDSTLEVGKSQIRDMSILDLSGAVSPWVRAAAPGAVRPPEYLWEAWAKGDRLRELSLAVDEALRRGWWIVTDAWTPRYVLAASSDAPKNIHIDPPAADQDFFVYLHDIYLKMWNLYARR
ncbi:MAG: hypothetical protein LBL73_03090 [Synergistaceae bacterium]|jgi:hypothetical protein|nr:hypothetical protein [Synergistaceae bacterium]